MTSYLEELREKELNLIVYQGKNVVFLSGKGGILPLIEAIAELGLDGLQDSIMVDRIVGRAAALLAVYARVAEVHALLISEGAKEVFSNHNLNFYFQDETSTILSKDGKDTCPFERLVKDINDPEEAYHKIKARISER